VASQKPLLQSESAAVVALNDFFWVRNLPVTQHIGLDFGVADVRPEWLEKLALECLQSMCGFASFVLRLLYRCA
jgi:hypothetical protein